MRRIYPVLIALVLVCCAGSAIRGDTMSTAQNGIPLNILANLVAPTNIASSTNASPIVVTTSAPHGLTTGDFVSINNHQVNVAANGDWAVSVLSNTTFQLLLSTGDGAGGATGVVTPRSVGPTFAIPSDGIDNVSAASVNVPFEALADRTAFEAALGIGAYRLSVANATIHDDNTGAIWDHFPTVTPGTWEDTSGPTIWTPLGATNVHIGDLIVFDVTVQVSATASVGGLTRPMLQLWWGVQVPGGLPAWAKVPGSNWSMQNVAAGDDQQASARFQGSVVSAFPGILNVKLQGTVLAGNLPPTQFILYGDYIVRATVYRPTGFPQ